MKGENIQERSKDLAVRIIKMVSLMPDNYSSRVFGNQIVRSATSSAANYRAACRSKSRRDFINKLKIVEEETDETGFWLEIILETGIFSKERLDPIIEENKEILAIIVRSVQTAKANGRKKAINTKNVECQK